MGQSATPILIGGSLAQGLARNDTLVDTNLSSWRRRKRLCLLTSLAHERCMNSRCSLCSHFLRTLGLL
jgi:hypothetical protein